MSGYAVQQARRRIVLDLIAAELVTVRQTNSVAFSLLVSQHHRLIRYGYSAHIVYQPREGYVDEAIGILLYNTHDDAWADRDTLTPRLFIEYADGAPNWYHYW